MDNSSNPVLIAILSAVMGLLGGLLTIPIGVIAARMLKSREQESQSQLELFAKKQDLLLRHRLELQRQSRVFRRIKLSIAELKNKQTIQAEEIDGIHAAHDGKLAAIDKSLAGLGQEADVLANKASQLDERLMLLEKRPVVEELPAASIAQLDARLALLEQLHDGLEHS
jgi:hypothetical protein